MNPSCTSRMLLCRSLPVTSLLVFLVLAAMYGVLFLMQTGQAVRDDTLARLAGPLTANDPQVLEVLKRYYLDPPSTLPFRPITHAKLADGQTGFTWPWINHFLKLLFSGHRDGFFIEAGALDGVYLSNTLWLEQELSWTGLLIEPDEVNYAALMKRHRRAWSSNTCISSKMYPRRTIFVSHGVRPNSKIRISPWSYRSHGHELKEGIDQSKHDLTDILTYSEVQCFPFLSYLAALNVTSVDLLSLDIQGTETEVISNFLASSSGVYIKVIVMENEYDIIDKKFMKIMEDQGYVLLAKGKDYIFVKGNDRVMQRPEIKAVLHYYATKRTRPIGTSGSPSTLEGNETLGLKMSAHE